LIICIIHLFLESYRWQMVPAYLFLGILWLIHKRSQQKPLGWVGNTSHIVWWFVSLFLPWSVPVFNLPQPTGPFEVGTVTFHWTDSSRSEWFTKESDDLRKLMVQFWYPAKNIKKSSTVPYMDFLEIRANAVAGQLNIPPFMLSHLHLINTNSTKNSEIGEKGNPFPILIFSHGLGGMRTQNTNLLEELASHGYVVAAMDHTYDCNMTIFPNGQTTDYRSSIPGGTSDSVWLQIRAHQLNTRVIDVQFVLDQFEKIESGDNSTPLSGHLDLNRIGIFGHSFGGATSVLTSIRDERIKACLALDGWFVPLILEDEETIITQPFLYIGQEGWSSWDEVRHKHYLKLLLDQGETDTYHFSVKGSKHYDYTDIPLFGPLGYLAGFTGEVSGRKMTKVVNKYVVEFFNTYLNPSYLNYKSKSLPTESLYYPEVTNHKD